jgi:uncharacterized membrane protein
LRIKLGSGLLQINLLGLLLILVIIFDLSGVFRVILGLPFLLFFPGYSLLLALFPRRERIGTFERMALSFGMSVVIVPLIGLLLNYTSWGIRLEPILFSVAFFTLVMSIIGGIKSARLAESERFSVAFDLKLPGRGGSVRDRVLTIILIIAISGTLGTLGYVLAMPKSGEHFTEFYVLGESGKAADYPHDLIVGETASVTVGIINREQATTSYRVEVRLGGEVIGRAGPVVLENDESWEEEVSFTPSVPGANQKVEFLLYKDGAIEPSAESLHLWINVTE